MSSEYWKGVLETARKRLEELRVRRDELDAEREEVNLEIVQVEQVVANLTPLVAEARQEVPGVIMDWEGFSLADACRKVLSTTNRHMTPIEVRDALEVSGYDLKQHNNALASIHGVLKRMAESGEVEPIAHDVRGTMYRWKGTGGTRVPGSTGGIGQLRRGGNGGDPPPAGTVPYINQSAGSGMSAREHMRKIVEDEKADLERGSNSAMNRLIRESVNRKKGALEEAYDKLKGSKKE